MNIEIISLKIDQLHRCHVQTVLMLYSVRRNAVTHPFIVIINSNADCSKLFGIRVHQSIAIWRCE